MISRSWWEVAPEPPEHRLPDDLRARDPFAARDCGWVTQMRPFVRACTRPEGVVFDPFCGFGTTLLAAALEGRRALGTEVVAGRVEIARERLRRHGADAQIVCGAWPDIPTPGPFDLCLTSVPYFGCGWPAADAAGQLYCAPDFARYLERMRDVFHVVREQLPEGGYCVAMVENIRLGAHAVPQAWELARILGSLFEPCEERVLVYPPRTGPMPGDADVSGLRSDRSHEYALVFRKRRAAVDVAEARALLRDLRAEGFCFAVYGSFLAWQDHDPEDASSLPADVDLLVADDPVHLRALLLRLESLGFRFRLWDRSVNADVRADSVRRHHYLCVERLRADGSLLRLDIAIAGSNDAS